MHERTKVLVFIPVLGLFLNFASPFALAETSPLFEIVKSELDRNHLRRSSLVQLQQFVEANPQNSDGRLYLGLVLERMGLKEQAQEQLKLAIKYGPDSPKALVELCKEEIRQGRVEAAKVLLNYGFRKFPNNPEILYLVGDFLIKQGEYAEAQRLLEKAFKLDKSIFGLPSALAQLALSRDYYRAVKYASLDLAVRPDYDRALRIRGVAYAGMHQYDKAAKDLSQVFEKNPTLTPISKLLSESYYWLGDYEKAMRPAVFYLAFTAKPESQNIGPSIWLAKVVRKLPKEKALELVDKYSADIATRFNLSVFYYFLGTAFDRIDYRDEAIRYYRKAIAGDDTQVLAHYRLGLDLELYKRDYDGALTALSRAHNLRPWDNEINLAYLRLQDRVYNKHRDFSTALKEWFSGLGH